MNRKQLRLLGIQGATSIELVTAATAKMATADLAAVLVKTSLTAEEQKQILMGRGLSASEAEAALATAAHSAATATATVTTGALTTSTLSLKAALNGLKAAFLSNPITAVITIALTLITVIARVVSAIKSGAEEAKQKARDAAQSIKDSFNQAIDSVSDNINKLNSLEAEFNKLSKGVDDYGNNISLTADEYERYREIVQTIVGISPELVAGYDNEGNAIANKNGLLEKSIALMEEQQRLEREKIVTDSNLKTLFGGSQADIKDAWDAIDDMLIPNDLAFSGVKINDKGERQSGFVNQIDQYVERAIGIDFDEWNDGGILNYIAKNIDTVYANLDKILENARTDFVDDNGNHWAGLSDSQVESLKSLILDVKRYADDAKEASNEFNEYLQLIPESLKQYSQLDSSSRDFLSQWIRDSFSIDENTSESDIKAYADKIKDFTKKLASDVNLQGIIADAMSLKNRNGDIKDLPVEEYKKQIQDLLTKINSIDDEDSKSFIKSVLGLDKDENALTKDVDKMMSRVKNILHDGYDDEIAGMSLSDLQIAYNISADADSLTFDELKAKIEEYKRGSLIDFSTLMQDEDFTDAVDEYIDKVTKLQTAFEKFRDGKLGNEDIAELIKEFPQLASETDNLGNAIQGLIGDLTGGEDELGNFSGIYGTFQSQFNRLDTDEDREQLQNFMDVVLALGQVVGSTQFAIDIDAETDGMEKLYSAMKESVSSTGLTAESIKNLKARYQDLENYDAAKLFERTYNGIHLNTKALRELEAEYEKQEKLKITDTLDDLTKQYNDLTEKINNSVDASEKADLYKQRQNILDRINDTADLAAMYDGLTSAFHRWEEAQSVGEEGDMYDSLADGLEHIKELFDEGLIGTNEFRAAVQLMSNEDLSTANIDQLIAAYESGYGTMTRYFQDSSDGCLNFLHDVQNLNSEWAHMNEDGSWDINFGFGDDQSVADALGINVESVQAIMRKLSDYGFDINLDSIFSKTELLKTKAEEANDALLKIGATDTVFSFDTDNLNTLNLQIQEAKDLLDSLYNDDGELNVKYSEDDVENAIAIIERLIYRKQSLDDAAILKVDTSNADNDITNIISKLQEFKSSYNNLEVQTAIGADTTEAQTACDGLLTEISGMDAEILATLGIDATSVDTLNESINSITPELMVKAGLDASLIEGYQAEEHTADGTVIWDNNIDKVTSWINQSHTARGEVKWYNNTYNVKTHFTASGTINWSGGGRAQGTAFSSGYWGTRNSGIALGGEVGQELVVRDGKFFTVGDNGAEMFQYKKDDIIFNAEQTRQILANGRIANGKKRGVTYAQGTAFSGGSGRITGSGSVITTPSGGSSGGSSSSGSSDSSKEDEPKVIDWIEVAINRIERAIDRLKTTAESTYKSLKKRLGAAYDEIAKVNQELSLQQKAYDRYMQQANSVGLSSDLAKKVQDGTIDISEYDSETAELISDYQEWYIIYATLYSNVY